jgi:hypothetical protein
MDEFKELLQVVLAFVAGAACVWLWLRVNLFFYERGWTPRRSPKVEIQTLFHGNTKDKDQI